MLFRFSYDVCPFNYLTDIIIRILLFYEKFEQNLMNINRRCLFTTPLKTYTFMKNLHIQFLYIGMSILDVSKSIHPSLHEMNVYTRRVICIVI